MSLHTDLICYCYHLGLLQSPLVIRHTRTTRPILLTDTVNHKAISYGLKPNTVHRRIYEGWEKHKAISAPLRWWDKGITKRARELGIKLDTVRSRIKRGWSVERALETPVKK